MNWVDDDYESNNYYKKIVNYGNDKKQSFESTFSYLEDIY